MTKLGATYRDKITGFCGVATGRVEYITGCNQVLLAPASDGNTFKSPEWFDEQRLEQTGENIIALDNSKSPGPDVSAPRR